MAAFRHSRRRKSAGVAPRQSTRRLQISTGMSASVRRPVALRSSVDAIRPIHSFTFSWGVGHCLGHPRQRLVHSTPVAMPTCRYKSWFGELVGALRESKSLCCGTWLPSSHDVVLRLVLSGSLIESVTVTSARHSRVTPKFLVRVPQGLNRLRKKAWIRAKSPKSMPHGLKPASFGAICGTT
jgi:hypothetical protein